MKAEVEGAGVKLNRAFGFGNTEESDPFLLLDDFRNDIVEDYKNDNLLKIKLHLSN